MTASIRAAKELEMLQDNLPAYLQDLCSEGSNVLIWNATLLPDLEPYNLRAFRFRITFPRNYPYKPPQLNFVTSIYHPQVTENGEVCLPSLHSNWKAHTTIHQGRLRVSASPQGLGFLGGVTHKAGWFIEQRTELGLGECERVRVELKGQG
uniref:Ubiquitin conjugating enzyme E2 L6 n=1 Tax=Monodelphis domestica TaxID=13616 RepID=A0A5F8GSB4_MONDO